MIRFSECLNTLHRFAAHDQGSDALWISGTKVSACKNLSNYVGVESSPQLLDHIQIAQRSKQLNSLREQFIVSGSTLNDAANFGSVADRKRMYKQVHDAMPKPEPSNDLKKAPKDLKQP